MEKHCNKFPREAVDGPFLKMVKVRLNGAWNNLVKWKVLLVMVVGGLEQNDL